MQIAQQDGDRLITDTALSLGFNQDQRESINRVRIHLRLLLISDLLVCKKNIIKHCFRHGLPDISYVSHFCWPVSVPCKKDIGVWKRLVSMISRSDGSLLSPVQWNNANRRHRQSTAFISSDKQFIQIIHEGEALVYQQTRLRNR